MTPDQPGLTLAFAGQIAAAKIKRAMAAHGLKPGHGHVLRLLSDDGATSQQALLETLGVDPSVLVALLNDLEQDGLAERRRDPADRRRHIVEISTQGSKLVKEIQTAIDEVEAELFADLNDDEIVALQHLLSRVSATAGRGCPEEA